MLIASHANRKLGYIYITSLVKTDLHRAIGFLAPAMSSNIVHERDALPTRASTTSDSDREKDMHSRSDSAFATGTYHQANLGTTAARKHFFAPLDAAYSEAVHLDAEYVEFTEEEEVDSQ